MFDQNFAVYGQPARGTAVHPRLAEGVRSDGFDLRELR